MKTIKQIIQKAVNQLRGIHMNDAYVEDEIDEREDEVKEELEDAIVEVTRGDDLGRGTFEANIQDLLNEFREHKNKTSMELLREVEAVVRIHKPKKELPPGVKEAAERTMQNLARRDLDEAITQTHKVCEDIDKVLEDSKHNIFFGFILRGLQFEVQRIEELILKGIKVVEIPKKRYYKFMSWQDFSDNRLFQIQQDATGVTRKDLMEVAKMYADGCQMQTKYRAVFNIITVDSPDVETVGVDMEQWPEGEVFDSWFDEMMEEYQVEVID